MLPLPQSLSKTQTSSSSKKALRHYEFIIITSAKIGEDHQNSLQTKYEQILTANQGVILDKDIWGVLKLAHPIKKQFRGFYICYNIACTVSAKKDCEKQMKIDAAVLRHLFVKLSDHISDQEIESTINSFKQAKIKEQELAKENQEKATLLAKDLYNAENDLEDSSVDHLDPDAIDHATNDENGDHDQ